jgi:hypothetical protein
VTHYLLSVHTSSEPRPPMTDEEMRQSWSKISALESEMRSAGALVFSGRLTEPAAASVVRAKGGRVRMTDGPFVEAKEQIGGFYIIDAPDLDAARSWAARTSEIIGSPIEVRPFAGLAS